MLANEIQLDRRNHKHIDEIRSIASDQKDIYKNDIQYVMRASPKQYRIKIKVYSSSVPEFVYYVVVVACKITSNWMDIVKGMENVLRQRSNTQFVMHVHKHTSAHAHATLKEKDRLDFKKSWEAQQKIRKRQQNLSTKIISNFIYRLLLLKGLWL